jgi:hypothetical protein
MEGEGKLVHGIENIKFSQFNELNDDRELLALSNHIEINDSIIKSL